MKLWKLGFVLVVSCIIVFSLVLIVPIVIYEPDLPAELDLATSIRNAVEFFEGSSEPYALLWLDVMYRRFGISDFADALNRYDQVLAQQSPLSEQAIRLRVFRRIAEYRNQLSAEDLSAMLKTFEYYTVYALYSDRLELPLDYPEMLRREADKGDYYLTHVVLAWIWIQENGYDLELPDGFIDGVYNDVVAIVNKEPTIVNDLKLEAAAFLYLAGKDELVDSAFIECVVASQNDEGGWAFSGDGQNGSHWHSTILGLLLLLHEEYPADSYPPVLNSPST